MPSNKEIEELQKQYPNMRVWGVDFNSFRENPRLGDILVIPFYDVIDALAACEQRVLSVAGPHNYSRGRKDGYAAGLDAAREAVAALPRLTGVEAALAAIDALREEQP